MIHLGKTTDGQPVTLDPTRLIDSRMLIQGGSGAGKSWMMRLIAEQAGLQFIIIDPEGEFATLREKIDCLIVGEDGELEPDPKSAALLARRLMEKRVSAVIDIFELKLDARRLFVKNFLDSLVNLPKSLWTPALIMVDEADVYCPEQSKKGAVSKDSVIDLMCRGRKRGYCGILATTRLAKLDKDAAAEAKNVFIGNTPYSDDRDRAGDILGMRKPEMIVLRDFQKGEFFGYGPAVNRNGVIRMRTAQVQTTHPEPGKRHGLIPPEPSKRIKGVLSELADLAKQAETEIRDLAAAQQEIARLKRELNSKPKPAADDKTIAVAVQRAEQARDRQHAESIRALQQQIAEYQRTHKTLVGRIDKAREVLTLNGERTMPEAVVVPKVERAPVAVSRPAPVVNHSPARSKAAEDTGDIKIDKCGRAILQVLSQFPEGCDRTKLTQLAGYRYSGGFQTTLGELRRAGLISGANNSTMQITDAGMDCGPFDPLPQGDELISYWLTHRTFDKCERAILKALVDAYPNAMTREEICETTGYKYSGGFQTALGRVRKAGLLVGKNTETMKASDHLF